MCKKGKEDSTLSAAMPNKSSGKQEVEEAGEPAPPTWNEDEKTVTWNAEGKLGIWFHTHTKGVQVVKVAARVPNWILDRQILEVNGTDVDGAARQTVVECIRQRPVTLRFGDILPREEPSRNAVAGYFAARERPPIQLSHMVPLALSIILPWVDIDAMGIAPEVILLGFILCQLPFMGVYYWLHCRISALPTGSETSTIEIPEEKTLGHVTKEAATMTPREYDMSIFEERIKQHLVGFWVVIGLFWKWQLTAPAIFTVFMFPAAMYDEPLVRVHLMGKSMERPYPAPNPFGLPVEKKK